jgi:hypothetical protein
MIIMLWVRTFKARSRCRLRAVLPRSAEPRFRFIMLVAAMTEFAETLRNVIENLIDAKLNDALKPGGLDRLRAHRVTGVASIDIRNAERRTSVWSRSQVIPEDRAATASALTPRSQST